VLKRLFLSEHFYSPALMHEQVKSPAVLVAGMVRSLLTPARDLGVLNDALGLMGQRLFFPPSVAGWAGGRSWINTSTLFARQNTACYLLTGRSPSHVDPLAGRERYDPSRLLRALDEEEDGASRDPERVAAFLLRHCVGRAESRNIAPLVRHARENGGRVTDETVIGMLLLISAMPEYQLC